MMGYGMMGHGMGLGIFMMLFWIGVIIGGVILVGYGIVQLLGRNRGGKNPPETNRALEQLKVRLASGEISKEEYLEYKEVLQS